MRKKEETRESRAEHYKSKVTKLLLIYGVKAFFDSCLKPFRKHQL